MAAQSSNLKKYRAAIKRNFPDFPLTKISYLAEGWDSVAHLVNDEWIFRFPKRHEVAQHLLQVEIPLTIALAQHLPLPIPQFELIATNPVGIEPFAAYKMLSGEPLDDFTPEIWQENWWQRSVAEFLVTLHSFPIKKAITLGATPLALTSVPSPDLISAANLDLMSAWRQSLLDFYNQIEQEIYPLISLDERKAISSQYQAFIENPVFFEFIPTLIHGDFSTEHVLLDISERRVCGVIDFGDVALGDPAYDLWPELLPFYREFNPSVTNDTTLEERCLFYKKLVPLHALLFGKQMNDFALSEFGHYELERLWLNS